MFDALQAEKKEADVLIDRGGKFTVPKQSFLKFFGTKERSFTIKQPYLGTLDLISRELLDLKLDETKLSENPVAESRVVIAASAKKLALVAAMVVLNNKLKIRLFAGLLAQYFYWHLTPEQLFQLTITIAETSNLGDFINSIRYLAGIRTTTPRIEEKQQA